MRPAHRLDNLPLPSALAEGKPCVSCCRDGNSRVTLPISPAGVSHAEYPDWFEPPSPGALRSSQRRRRGRCDDALVTPAPPLQRSLTPIYSGVDAESLNAGEGRRAGNVSSLSAAPGLLNGSVVLPPPKRSPSGRAAAGGVADAGATTGRSSAPRAAHGNVGRSNSRGGLRVPAQRGARRRWCRRAAHGGGARQGAQGGQPNNVLLGRIGGLPTSAPALDPTAVGKSAEMLIEKYAGNYGVPDAWYNIDPNHAASERPARRHER